MRECVSWRVAIYRLKNAGHHAIAKLVDDFRSRDNDHKGWDRWFETTFSHEIQQIVWRYR